jgi:type VI secretion system protein ImpA
MYPIHVSERLDFDLDSLLAPISEESPTGESLRYEGTYDKIRAARTEDDAILARGVWKIPLKRADWPAVERMCLEALQNRAKDLQIAAWLLDAWVHSYGFAGLRDGLRVVAALCDAFWDHLHPGAESGDIEYRLAPIVWIDEKLPVVVRLLPLTHPVSDDIRAYCWDDWESACRKAGPDRDSGHETATQALFQQSALLTPPDFYKVLMKDLEGSMNACSQLESILESQCGKEAPSLRQLWSSMESIRELITSIMGQREVSPEERNETVPATAPANLEPHPPDFPFEEIAVAGPIHNRAEAYRRLSEAADYLARTEPHSPTPYLVRRAIAWGSMRLEDLLPELLHNSSELAEIFRLLQIAKPGGK